MNATTALIRIQFHFMKWPLVALTTSTIILLFFPERPDILAVFGYLARMSLPLMVWLVGPVLFGYEYVEGARDYIDTKPVSINQVFWIKILFLIPFVVCCACLYIPDILVSVFFLNIALAGVAMTVLFKDMVRGILTGPFAAFLFGVLLLIPWYVLCGNHTSKPWEYTGGEYPWIIQLLIKINEYFLPGIIILSPLIFIWATRWMYQFRRTGSWCPPLDGSMVLLLPCLLYAGFANSCWWHEGSFSYIHFPLLSGSQKQEPFRSCLARVLVENKQRYLSLGKKEGEFVVHELDSDVRDTTPRELFRFRSSMAHESVLERRQKGEFHGWEPWIDEKNIVLFNNQSKDAVCIHYNTSGMIDSNTISLDMQPVIISKINAEKLLIHGMISEATGTEQGQPNYRDVELDLLTGEVKPLSGDPNTMPGLHVRNDFVFSVIQTKSRCYRMWLDLNGNVPVLEWKESSAPVDTPFSSPMLRVLNPTVDNSLVAAQYMERVSSITEPIGITDPKTFIYLCDTAAKGDLKILKIQVPFLMAGAYDKLYDAYRLLGLKDVDQNNGLPVPWSQGHVALGGGFLFSWALQIGRVAVWDIHDLSNIRFIGISDCPAEYYVVDHSNMFQNGMPHTVTPHIRSDGALGFIVNNYGPVWLEFPALKHKT